MRTTTLQAGKTKLLLVEVPEDASEIELNGHSLEYVTDLDSEFHDIEITGECVYCYTLLGTITNGSINFDCEGLVDKTEMPDGIYYRKYNERIKTMTFQDGDSVTSEGNYSRIVNCKPFTAKDSFLSLIEANGVILKNPHGKPPLRMMHITDAKLSKNINIQNQLQKEKEYREAEKSVWKKIVCLTIN